MENEDRPLIGSEQIDGSPYIFKRYDIIIFPLRPGKLKVPSFSVYFSYRSNAGRVASRSSKTRPLLFKVLKIPGANSRKPVITTTSLMIDELWEPKPGSAHVGDALVRKITLTADDLPGMLFPPLRLKKVDGLGLYFRSPHLEDQRQRGVFIGRRTEIVTYVCERPGRFIIPALSLQWWNPERETLGRVFLPEVKIKVSAGPVLGRDDLSGSAQAVSSGFSWRWLVLFIPFLGLMVTGIVRFYQKKQRRERFNADAAEKELFQEFKKAAHSHNAVVAMRTLIAWLDQSKIAGNHPTLQHLCEITGDPELKKEVIFLETSLYAVKSDCQWYGDKLFSTLQQARKNLKKRSHYDRLADLPELNPRH